MKHIRYPNKISACQAVWICHVGTIGNTDYMEELVKTNKGEMKYKTFALSEVEI
jgi:hypothetical protein